MIGLGFAEILMLALLSGGMNSTDLVALVQPDDYFKSRRIDPSIDRLIDFVIQDPTTPKAQVLQLVSLRHLADDSDNFKKAKNYATNRLAIEEIAEGKRASDPQGFAQEYARRILAKLDGIKTAPPKIKALREDALDWFPADVKFAGAIEFRQSGDTPNDTLKNLLKLMPPQAKTQMYDLIEKIGNLRLERMAFGMVDAKNREDQKIFVRVTGKANQTWLASALTTFAGGNFATRKLKADDDTPILLMQDQHGPALVVVGHTDLLIVGYQKHNGRHEDVVTEMLEVRAKKKPNSSTGTLKDRLTKVPDKAGAFLIGEIPDDAKRELAQMFHPLPTNVSVYVERTAKGLEVKAEANLANADDAGSFLDKAGELRKKGVAEIQKEMKRPVQPGAPAVPFQAIIDLMESVQMQKNGDKVQMQGFVSENLVQQLGQMSILYATPHRADPPVKDFDR